MIYFVHLCLMAALLMTADASLAATTVGKSGLARVRNNANGSQTLFGHVPQAVQAANIQGHQSAEKMVDLRIVLPLRNQSQLDQFVRDIYDPKSPIYHQFVTPDQFALMFGASKVDTDIVKQFLQSQGLTVKSQSKNGLILTVTGTTAKVENAFKLSINNYKGSDGAVFYAPDQDPTIPVQVAGKIYGIVGMDNAARFKPNHTRTKLNTQAASAPKTALRRGVASYAPAAAAPAFTGPSGTIAPTDIRTAYNLNTLTSDGTGQKLALFELDGFLDSDITTYRNFFGLPNVPITTIKVDGFSGTPGKDTGEVVLDIDVAIATAPGLSEILVYESPNTGSGWIDQWQKIADDNLAKVVSVSWGLDEDNSYPFYDHTVFSQLAAQGQSVFASAGDAGAYDNCDGGTLPPNCKDGVNTITGVLSVDDPASDPFITGVGISILTTNGNGTYNHETASLYGGGGISHFVSIPTYQQGLTLAPGSQVSSTMRNVPDVSLTADPSTGYAIFITDPTSGTGWYSVWGSSAAAPIWAAFMTRVNQGRAVLGPTPVGWVNPKIYQIAKNNTKYANDFHDVQGGTNSFYSALAGYDLATGLGSFNGVNLYNDLLSPAFPTSLTATSGNAQVSLSWSASTGATSYNIKRGTVSGGPYSTAVASAVTGTSFIDNSTNDPGHVPVNGTTYFYVVSAVNDAGESYNSAQASATPLGSVPTAPTTVTAVAGNGQATVTFSGALANGNAITSYTVTSSPGGLTASGSASPLTVTGLTNGTAYTFTVRATNSIGTSSASAASNSVTPAGAPSAPTTVTAVAGNGQATVTFSGASANGSTITSYTVTSSPGGLTVSGSASPLTVTGLTNGTAYTFTVRSTNAVGTSSASSSSNSVTPAGAPSAPTTLSATAANAQATITFSGAQANGSAITSYTATSSPGGLTATGSASPLTVTGLTNGTAYTFTVRAINSIGTSAASAASNSVTPAGAPSAPTTVTAVAGNGQVTVTFSGASANGSAITGYTVTSSPGGLTATGSASPLTVTGLSNGTAYTFTVTAANAVGVSSASTASNSVTPNIVPGAPTAVSATAGNAQASVSFTAPVPNGGSAVLSYTVTSSPGGLTATGSSSPLTVSGLTNGTAYTFTVVANNATGPGAVSAPSNSVTPAGAPTAPTTVTAVAGNTQATVTFSGASANGSTITGYTVTSSPGGLTATGSASPLTVTGLTNGTAYTFTVSAINGVGTSAASGASNSVTPNIVPGAPTAVSAAAGNNQASVSFTPPVSNGGTAVLSYTVTSSPGGLTATGSASPLTVTGLTNGTAYTFSVVATNAAGSGASSLASNSVTPAGVPVAPTSVTAVAGNSQATVTFSGALANGSAITGYTVTS